MKKNTHIKVLFVLGFCLQILAQISFSFTDTFNLLEPIDFIHWTLLIGYVLIIPGVLHFSKGKFSKVGVPITMAGIMASIGMCTIDFVLWSFNSNLEERANMYYHLVAEPAIWPVFISVGPTLLFVGLSIQSFDYINTNLKGMFITLFGSITTGIGGLLLPQEYHAVMLIGYIVFVIGLFILFLPKKQENTKHNKLYDYLFLTGILFEVIGQLLFVLVSVYDLKPIDFAHWSLFLGVAFAIPKMVNFPKGIITYIGTPIAMAGAICILGMCLLDFIWWSQPNQEIRNEFASHLSQFPSIWDVFIKKGTGYFNIGLFILSLNYLRQNKLGVLVILIATLFIFGIIPIPYKMIIGYLTTLIGFGLLFFTKTTINEHKDKQI
ncbi:hypothetical protein [Tenacibaculum amylolyticum]|uniref:hypothetical protein n=1 Tax=Tenacibaculum amylolyticum TaxID=104269 RepID=UPI0038B56EFA